MSHYTVVKNSLANIIRNEGDGEIIERAVRAVNHIVIQTMQFMKLYLLGQILLPKIDVRFVRYCMRVVREVKIDGRTKEAGEYEKLVRSFNVHYRPTMSGPEQQQMNMKNLTQILDYGATQIVTQYETNIKEHFGDCIESFVDVLFDKKGVWPDLDAPGRVALVRQLRSYKSLILERKTAQLPEQLQKHLAFILPAGILTSVKHINYELAKDPQAFLSPMVYMMRFVETRGHKMMNVFPCRTNIVPKYIRFDTVSLMCLLLKEADRGGNTLQYYKQNVQREQAFLWGLYFKTEAPCFRCKNGQYQFSYMIETDGVGCSILLVNKDVAGVKYKPKEKSGPPVDLYLDNLGEQERVRLRDKKMVAIDPNKSDLLYCTTESAHFRYTQNQRNKESKQSVYRKQRLKMKKQLVAEDKDATAIETELSHFNHKTLNFDGYRAYLAKKNEINAKLFEFYENEVYRRMRWNAYINMSRSEQRMLNKFEAKFGSPDEVVIAFGDWEQLHQMKFKQPTKGKGFRKLFRKQGYEVFLVDEFRTSCMCYACGDEQGRCEKWKMVANKSPRSKKERPEILCHGLLRCTTCSRIWNRDVNASLNIGRAAHAMLSNGTRPPYLSRSLLGKTKGDGDLPTPPTKRAKITSVHDEACTTHSIAFIGRVRYKTSLQLRTHLTGSIYFATTSLTLTHPDINSSGTTG